MDTILQGLLELSGVSATVLFDGTGRLVGHRGHAVYDRSLCEQVSATLVKATDAVQLQQSDWEWITAQFADGKLLLRNLGATRDGRTHVLGLVAGAGLNASFATVALRVAATKLRKVLEDGGSTGPGSSSATALAAAHAPPTASSSHPPSDSRPVLANSGLSWSKISSVGLSRVSIADPAAGAFLSRCAKELARHVGPISKVYVEEAVRRASPETPFSLSSAGALVEDLAGQIEDPEDRSKFLSALKNGK
jgi:hypothetical protein